MISLRHAFFATVCTALIFSCSKHKDSESKETSPIDTCNQILKVSFYSYGNPTWQPEATITYDAQGRVQHVSGQGQNAATYTYYNDRIELLATDLYGNNIGLTYYLDLKGRVKGTSYFDNQFTYNADGYLVSYRQPYSNNNQIMGYTPYTLHYVNGDLTEVSTTENVANKKMNFGYYDEPNQDLMGYNQPLYIASVLGDRNSFYLIKAGFFGKQSAHLYKSLDLNDYRGPQQVQYTKDKNGRITTFVGAYSFAYQCP